ncbi:MAG: ferredoxin-thioredoxin reductase catalytic domain-containing protein [Patescibacteria group bacterium]|jgi:ferredoxin-thioredoxin reductase catalytic subunit
MDTKTTKIIEVWKKLGNQQQVFKINPDSSKVEKLATGVLNNEEKHGLKFCPCRMKSGNAVEDLKLVCPCNFFVQKVWQEKGECWCGLFIKK